MAQLEVRRRSTPTAAKDVAAIPDKLYFRIGEVADLCGLPAYVLRFWETEFPQLKPNKGGTGQRLYRQRDVRMVLRIKSLLYEGGFTIPGARQMLLAESRSREPELALAIPVNAEVPGPDRVGLKQLRGEMVALLEMLEKAPEGGMKKVHPIRTVRDRQTPLATSRYLFE